ncbi:MAG TPA: preprotein translocase subunit SecG [Candidatus Scatovivens faecipullorum]|nr:preprotein translocase subunit SecG [Candidatus Scatovivens faecipullorum]
MEIVKYIIMGIYAIVCLALIVLIFKQSKEDSGASGTIVGASANNFYEKNKGKTTEGRMKRATITLMIVFAVLTLALGIIYVV